MQAAFDMDFDQELDAFQDLMQAAYDGAYRLYQEAVFADKPDYEAASYASGRMLAIQRTFDLLEKVTTEWGFIGPEDWDRVIDAFDGDEYSLVMWSKENEALPKAPGAMQAMIGKIREDMEAGIGSSALVVQATEAARADMEDIQIGKLREGMVFWVNELDVLAEKGFAANLQALGDTTKRIVEKTLRP